MAAIGAPELWLSDGWATVQREGWEAPLYWRATATSWSIFTLARPPRGSIRPSRSCHVSYYEADAFARWAGKRLPTEAEWEIAAAESVVPLRGNFDGSCGFYHPHSRVAERRTTRSR